MTREQEDRLLEDYIETLREKSNWSVSFSEFKDREKTRDKEFEEEARIRQHNKKEGERIKKMRKYDTR